ncbi:MAG: diguanylate cyclase [Sedimentisphaerales bacterium]|jgi:diguanylate cyclase (GGDEF)-like protein/putative nucleotidyltransferase with HDIG domain
MDLEHQKIDGIVERPAEIISISHNATIKAAAVKMFTNKVGCLIVNNDNGDFIGVVTERDIINRVAASSIDIERTTIDEIMTTKVISCSPNTASSKVREIMTSHQIRHLPIVDNKVVVGILSTRDLMARQLLEDRAAAEEVAMLSTCLKSIDLNEVADIVTREVPKLFGAEKCVLFIRRYDSTTKASTLISYNNCSCPKESLCQIKDIPQFFNGAEFHYDSIPCVCEKLGGQSPRLVIPLNISTHRFSPESSLLRSKTALANQNGGGGRGCYLCMCCLAASTATNRELTSYKAKLAREILNSHLTNAKLYQEARLTSLTDALTGVGSRKLLEDKLQAECARAKRYKRQFSVAIIDLDNFKTINDILGHATGDDTLRKLAQCMKGQKRISDVLTRYGGDEFVILMPETKAEDAVTLLERIRDKVQGIKVVENFAMTISCGIAQSLFDAPDSSREIIRRADMALYEAKSAGRNCVKVWDKSMSKTLNDNDIETEKIKQLQRRIAGLSVQAEKVFIQSIWGLVQALEAKDPYTKEHSENVMHYAVGIAQTMKIAPKQLKTIRRAAMIHDIGKIGIPDAILSKPGKLTPRERAIIEQHPLVAVRILDKMTFLEQEIAIVRHHHEKWNGQGYPDGLSNTSIPLGARIMAVADTFDALTSNRPYHNSRSLNKAIEILVDSSGYDYDPRAVNGMVEWVQKVRSQLGVAQLTPEDLLDSQKQLDQSSMAPLVAEAITK